MGTLLHCVCSKCGKRFMQFEDKEVKCPKCGSKDYTVKSTAQKDIEP